MSDIFAQIKQRVTIPQAAGRYGIDSRKNTALCPFHKEKTPSLHINETYFHCFGCGVGGDVIKLVELLFHLSPLEATKKLNEDFGLGLETGKPLSREQMEQYQREHALYNAFMAWERRIFAKLTKQMYGYRKIIETGEPCSNTWCEAIRKLEQAEYYTDILIFGCFEDKYSLYKQLKDGDRLGK